MRLFRPLFFTPLVFREAIFRIRTSEKVLSLTFDDGPDINITGRILEIIEKYSIRAVFFCTGHSAETHPGLMERILSGGHILGNHGYYHLNGFRTPTEEYVRNVYDAAAVTSGSIFRPPYGLLTPSQYRILSRTFKIVFWDVMPYDFDPYFGSKRSLAVLEDKIREGSIIVLHNNPVSTAPEFLDEFINIALSAGYRFDNPSFLKEVS
jgi:peptidoglycan-N-acetylglucosamine deacetylase